MEFRAGVQLFGFIAVAVFAATSVLGQPKGLLNAVAFALTGSDVTPVQVIDQANCVFMVNPKTENGRLVGEVFHLNNVPTDRISIQPWKNVAGPWVQVELRGASTIYEYTGAYNADEPLKACFGLASPPISRSNSTRPKWTACLERGNTFTQTAAKGAEAPSNARRTGYSSARG